MAGKYLFQIRFTAGDSFTLCADTIEEFGDRYTFKINDEEVASYDVEKVVGWSKSEAPYSGDD